MLEQHCRMSTLIIARDATAILFYHPSSKIIHHQFGRDLTSDDLRDVLNRGVDLLKEHGATKWLSDNRAIEPHSKEDSDWVNSNWLPRAIAAGWKFWALVVPDSTKARMNMREFVEEFYNRGVRVMVFIDIEEAMHWLEAQK
jgi:hypothetical protein